MNETSLPQDNESTGASSGFGRRRFLRSAALTGAAALAAPRVFSQQENASTGAPVTSLIRPSVSPDPSLPPLAPPDRQPPGLELPVPTRKLGWAVVGLGTLAVNKILPAFSGCDHARLVALVSGHPAKAQQLAEVYGVKPGAVYNYENFDSMRDNPEIDVVYIVLPNSMHAEFSIRALQAGKHVLCEKPLAVSVAECEAMMAAADKAGRKLGVAYRLHYEPMNKAVMKMCQEKKFGPVKYFFASNSTNINAPNIRLSGALGGGPLGDMGVYCINAARYTIGEQPLEAMAVAVQPKSEPRFLEVPETVSFLLRYASGAVAECQCSFGMARSSEYQAICETGSITMNPAFFYDGLRLSTESPGDGGQARTDILLSQVDHFTAEMDGFSECAIKNTPLPTPAQMGLDDLRVVLAVLESARLGGAPVKVGGTA